MAKKIFLLETREGNRFLLTQCRVVLTNDADNTKKKPTFLLSSPLDLRRLATALERAK